MPDAFAGGALDAHQRIAEQVVPEPVPTVHVVGRTRQREIGQPQFLVGADQRPEIRLARVRPRVFFPGVIADFAGLRDDAERPARFAAAYVERLYVPRGLHFGLRRIGHRRSRQDDVATHLRAAARLIGRRAWTETWLQVHTPAAAPRRH